MSAQEKRTMAEDNERSLAELSATLETLHKRLVDQSVTELEAEVDKACEAATNALFMIRRALAKATALRERTIAVESGDDMDHMVDSFRIEAILVQARDLLVDSLPHLPRVEAPLPEPLVRKPDYEWATIAPLRTGGQAICTYACSRCGVEYMDVFNMEGPPPALPDGWKINDDDVVCKCCGGSNDE